MRCLVHITCISFADILQAGQSIALMLSDAHVTFWGGFGGSVNRSEWWRVEGDREGSQLPAFLLTSKATAELGAFGSTAQRRISGRRPRAVSHCPACHHTPLIQCCGF